MPSSGHFLVPTCYCELIAIEEVTLLRINRNRIGNFGDVALGGGIGEI
jgi:hypothetical protein